MRPAALSPKRIPKETALLDIRGVRMTSSRQLSFWRGGTFDVQMAYETWGSLNEQKNNVVLVLPGLSPSTHAASSDANPSAGWWEAVIGPQKSICTDTHFVICINHLGSCFGSTGPASIATDGSPIGLSFPRLSIEDLAMAATFVLDELGLNQ